jgi:hypothetical protein
MIHSCITDRVIGDPVCRRHIEAQTVNISTFIKEEPFYLPEEEEMSIPGLFGAIDVFLDSGGVSPSG